jgi:hypothetical protein
MLSPGLKYRNSKVENGDVVPQLVEEKHSGFAPLRVPLSTSRFVTGLIHSETITDSGSLIVLEFSYVVSGGVLLPLRYSLVMAGCPVATQLTVVSRCLSCMTG